MKFVRKKLIKGREYYYFEFPFTAGGKRFIFSRYIGSELPNDIRERMSGFFRAITAISEKNIGRNVQSHFSPKSIYPIEETRFWYQSLHHELFENDIRLFRSLFSILFLLNSNRAEGSKVTKKDIEKFIRRKQKPKTQLDIEIINSFAALRFAFSKKMKWTIKSIKILHRLLFDRIAPEIGGKFKKENVIIYNESTTDWKLVRKELGVLLKWLLKNRKKYYPPLVALKFHYRFEAIHPFEDGNGRIGRLLFNALLLQSGYMPVIFFSENHEKYCAALSKARQGRKKKLAHYFLHQIVKTKKAVLQYKHEGRIRGGSPQVGQWEIEYGKIRRY